MANVTIKLSQNVVDQQHAFEVNASLLGGPLGGLVDRVEQADYGVDFDYSNFVSWSLAGSTLRTTYADGATETYTGLVQANPAATSGTASATGYQFHKDGLLTLAVAGQLNYDYVITPTANGNNLSFGTSAQGSSFTELSIATELPATSPDYDPVLGNVAVTVNGAVTMAPTGALSGRISKLTASADKFLLSSTVEGDFFIVGNLLSDGVGQTNSVVEGPLTGYNEQYRDGSQIMFSGLSAYINANDNLDAELLLNGYHVPGDDNISVEMPDHLYADFNIGAGAGNDRISIKGGGGHLNVNAGEGNDQITILGDSHNVYGSLGTDTVILPSARANYTLVSIPPSSPNPLEQRIFFTVTDKAGVVNSLGDVERIQFSDATVALDIDGTAGQAYRLYQAAFNRPPDSVGLGFWIDVMDHGTTLASVAQGFVDSIEFRDAYSSSHSNRELVTQFYQNILHRAPEAGGLDFWTNVLDTKAAGTADVLAAISESAENKAGLVGVIGNGFEFTPYVHG